MMRRRDVVLGGISTIACGCACARGGTPAPDCFADETTVRALVDKKAHVFNFSVKAEPALSGSGDRDFDRALGIALVRLSDLFDVLPGFAFYDDSGSPNAFASDSQQLGREDGSVLFGRTLLRRFLSKQHGDAAVIGACAHEFGHIAQMKRHAYDRLKVNGKVKRLELHADFLAGYFAGRRKAERSDFPAADIALGHYYLGDSDFNGRDHHGTPEERGQSVVEGFQAAYRDRKSFDRAFADGMDFAERFRV